MSKLAEAISRLAEKPAEHKPFDPLPAVGAKPPAVGRAQAPSASKDGAGAAAASATYTETSYAARLNHPSKTAVSADGFFRLIYPPPARIVMTDDGGNIVHFNYAEPT